jgi:hypothetical protein
MFDDHEATLIELVWDTPVAIPKRALKAVERRQESPDQICVSIFAKFFLFALGPFAQVFKISELS